MRICIKNATIVNEGEKYVGTVIVEDELIYAVIKGNPEPQTKCDRVIDANGYYLIPGVIDDHVHFREPGLTHKADIATESSAAAAGGVTSFMDMPNCKPQTVTIEALEEKFNLASQKSIVNYSFYFGATNDNTDLFSQLDKTRVCGIKLFMGASTGNMLVEKRESLKRIFQAAPILIATHCENPEIIEWNTELAKMKFGEDPDIEYHSRIRSEAACWESTKEAVLLAQETGARLHVLHLSTARELSLFTDLPVSQKQITSEACVSHLMFCEDDYGNYGARIKCNPSVKTSKDREALHRALRTNLIDVIATDHAPHLLSEKEGGALKAASGMPSIQFSLNCMMELVRQGIFTIEQMVNKMCHTPADLFQIDKRGYIRPGYKADLVILNPEAEWTVTKDCILSKCGWSPYEGQTFHTKVEKTFVNGNLVYTDGQVNEAYRGEPLRFNR